MRSPSFVSCTPARLRLSTAKPSSFSSASMLWLTADCVQPRLTAAVVRLPASTTLISV